MLVENAFHRTFTYSLNHRNAVYWCPAFLRMQDDPNSTSGKITAVYNDKPFLLIEYSHQTQKSNAGSS